MSNKNQLELKKKEQQKQRYRKNDTIRKQIIQLKKKYIKDLNTHLPTKDL